MPKTNMDFLPQRDSRLDPLGQIGQLFRGCQQIWDKLADQNKALARLSGVVDSIISGSIDFIRYLRLSGRLGGQTAFGGYNAGEKLRLGGSSHASGGNVEVVGAAGATVVTVTPAGKIANADTTDSTSKDTGSIVTEGGIGAEKAVFSGSSITATTFSKHAGHKMAVNTYTDNHALIATNDFVVMNKATEVLVTLPAATGSGAHYSISNIGIGQVVLTPNGTDTIHGEPTQRLKTGDSVQVVDYAAGKWRAI